MNIRRFAAAALCVFGAAFSASAASQLDVTGSGSGASLGPLAPFEGAVQTFDIHQDITDATISIDLALCNGDCEGKVSLYSRAPDLTTTDNVYTTSIVRDVRFCATPRFACDALAPASSGFSRPVLSGINLLAGNTYSLVVAVIDGGAIWFGSNGSATRTITNTSAASHGDSYTIATLTDATWTLHNELSSFAPGAFNYNIDGTVSATVIPLPAGGLLLGSALLVLRRTRKLR